MLRIVTALAATIVLAGGGVGGGLLIGGGPPALYQWVEEARATLLGSSNEAVQGADPKETLLELPTIIVNRTAGTGGHLRLRIAIAAPAHEMEAVTHARPYLLDMMNAYLPELIDEDVRGSAGFTRLRRDLRYRFNLAMNRDAVSDVLIQELLIK